MKNYKQHKYAVEIQHLLDAIDSVGVEDCEYFNDCSTDELKAKFKESIRDHWEIERPEKEPMMNLTYAMTGAKEFDLDETIWWLQKHPMDHISWRIENSHRHDIEKLPMPIDRPVNLSSKGTKISKSITSFPLGSSIPSSFAIHSRSAEKPIKFFDLLS